LKIGRLSGNYLEILRKHRKRLVTSLYQEISESELMEHLQTIILILRNFSFVKLNETVILKHNVILELVISLFIDSKDRTLTFNCLDIITNLAKMIDLK